MNLRLNIAFHLLRYALSFRAVKRGLLVIAFLGLLGCSATYTGGSVSSPDGQYVLYGHVRGAYGRPFIDQNTKTICVDIVAKSAGGEKTLLKRRYHVKGSDVCWDAIWDKEGNLTFVSYDYGVGVSFYDARKNGTPKRRISIVTYRYDPKTGTFGEQSAK